MMIIDSEIEKYITEHSDTEEQLLKDLSRETHLKMVHPRMLSGALQGEILKTFSFMMQPQKILELGTYTGYSAICLAQGLQKNGKLITIDIDDEVIYLARKYFKLANLNDKIVSQNKLVGYLIAVQFYASLRVLHFHSATNHLRISNALLDKCWILRCNDLGKFADNESYLVANSNLHLIRFCKNLNL